MTAVLPVFEMSRVDYIDREYDVVQILVGGGTGTLTSVGVALVPPDLTSPGSGTVWATVTVTAGTATITLAGPAANPAGATLTVPSWGGTVWMRATDTPIVIARPVEQVTIS